MSIDDTRATYRDRGLGARSAPGRRPALLVVDLVLAFTDPRSDLACDADAAVAATASLLERFRAASWPVVFTTVVYDEAGAATAATFLDKVPALATLTPDSPWVGVDPRIAPVAGEAVVAKLFASSFFGTTLDTMLRAAGADTVVVTGASTSGCVRATVVDAMQHGFRVVVPLEGVADRAAGAHEASLADIQSRYGEVMALAEVHGWLEGLAAQA